MSTLTTSIGDLETTLVDIRDSVSNATHVSNFIQETFSSLTGDVTLEETLGSLGDALARHVKWKKLGIRWRAIYTMGESAFKRGVCIDKDCQMEENRRYIRGRDTMGKDTHHIRRRSGEKNGRT